MSEYRIRGSGDVRDVMDGDVLIGTIKRKSRKVVAWSLCPTRAVGRTKTETWWIAFRTDGTPVRWRDGRRLCRDHMKDWRKRDNWCGAHVEPWPTPTADAVQP